MRLLGQLPVLAALVLTVGCASQQQVTQNSSVNKNKSQMSQQQSLPEPLTQRVQLADEVLVRAIGLVGTPYRWGGSSPETGFDCSGLIGYVYKDSTGLKLPRSTSEMVQVNAPSIAKEKLAAGDIVFFATNGGRRVSHAGIYVGDGRFVHAPSSGGKVRLDRLDAPYWHKAYLQAKRYLPDQQLASNP